jgi:rhomboid protease GluP
LLTGLIASCSSLFWYENIVCVGASGAIFGMFGFLISALIFKSIQRKFQINSAVSILVFVGLNLAGSFDQEVDSAAHIGGFASGILLGIVYHLFRNKILVSRIISVGTTLLICGILITFALRSQHNVYELPQYWSGMSEFAAMEKRAIDGYYYPNGDDRKGFEKQLIDVSHYYWEENLKLIYELDRLNLPEEVHELNSECKTYCETHLKMVNYMLQDLREGKENYDDEIRELRTDLETQIEIIKRHVETIKKSDFNTPQKND